MGKARLYTDKNGDNPQSGAVVKEMILNGSFLTAWWAVSIYIMKLDLVPFHMQIMSFQLKNKKSLVMAGRGYGKSYVNNTAFTLTHILRNPHIRILIATQNNDQLSKFIREMKMYFEKGTVIYEIFGDLKGDIWQDTQFSLKRTRPIKETTVSGGSMNASGSIISSHFDLIILDDIVGEENARTKGQREKLKDYVFMTVIPTLESQNGYGEIHAIGTHYHPSDFWTTLEESGQYKVLKIKSLYEATDGREMSVWEKKKGVEELKQIKELIGSRNFGMQYQQVVSREKGGIFKLDWLQYFSRYEILNGAVNITTKDEETGEERREMTKVFIGVDLAISEKATADSFVISVIGVGVKNGNIYLLDMYRGKISFLEQMEKIKEYGEKWFMAERIGVESVGYQAAMAGTLTTTTSLPITSIKTRTDKTTRFGIFSGQWENYKVFLYDHIKALDILEDEILSFPEAVHDDTIDSFCIAWETYKGNQKRGGLNLEASKKLSGL